MLDDSTFEYKENTELTTARGVAENGSYASPISSVSEITIAHNTEDVKFQKRDPYNASDRDVLANALESAVTNEQDLNRLILYQKKIGVQTAVYVALFTFADVAKSDISCIIESEFRKGGHGIADR